MFIKVLDEKRLLPLIGIIAKMRAIAFFVEQSAGRK